MKRTLFYIILLLPFKITAQSTLSPDTIVINEVVISGKKIDEAPPGFRVNSLDSVITENYRMRTIAEAISAGSPIFIKTYGSGGIASSSLRGTGASGTGVTWNGIGIDNPMLGQSDLSILTAGMTDRINIYYGGASMILKSGSSGGIISLESEPVWEDRTRISFSPVFGSFGKYGGQLFAFTGTTGFQSITKGNIQASENDFPYIDNVSGSESVRKFRKNSQVRQGSFMQEFYGKLPGGVISAHFWYQDAHRNLPSSLLTEYAGERQYDESFRSLLHYESNRKYSITAAYLVSDLKYLNKLANINSLNRSDEVILKSGLKRNLSRLFMLNLLLNEKLTTVNSNNYSKRVYRNTADIAMSIQTTNVGSVRGSFLARQILYDNKLLIPDFSAGLIFKPFSSEEYYLKSNLSRSSRVPSMNDLYWFPGGNPGLKNEYAVMSEAGFEMDDKFSSVGFHFDLTFFRNAVKDMIQWRPGAYSYWTAENVNNVLAKGIETSVSFSYRRGKISSVFKACYSFTSAKDEDDRNMKKQLVYVPENMANAILQFNYGMIHSEWLTGLTGIRFTSADNEDFMPSYINNNFAAGFRHKAGWGMLDFTLNIDNIFNAEYQNIAYYPMPGRSYELKILAQTTFRK